MDEKRRDVGSPSPAATISGESSLKSTASPVTEPPAPRRRGQKRKSNTSGSSSAPPKRHAREKAAAAAASAAAGFSAFLSPTHNGPLTRARQLSDSNAAISSVLNAVSTEKSAPESNGGDVREDVNVVKKNYEALEAVIEAEFDAIRSKGANSHVVPVTAGWFSWTHIHPLEKQSLVSFFNGKLDSRTPEIYLEIRNWIMKRFHTNPSLNIEVKDLSELSIGDLDARHEVLEFLDYWGLINYRPFPLNDSAKTDADPNRDVDKEDRTESLIEKLYQFENEQPFSEMVPKGNASTLAMPTGLLPESAIAEELIKQEGPAVEYHCNSCSADCSRKRYHCQKQADFDLCTDCYNNGKFGSGMNPSDFIIMEPGEASVASGGKWTDQETLLLLEALELYKENWNEIAEHVATKTKAQCIMHFLQMPIEDSFLDHDDTIDGNKEIAEPTTTNNDSSLPKDKAEVSENKTEASENKTEASENKTEALENETDKDGSEMVDSGSVEPNSEKPENNSKDDPELPEKKTDSDIAQLASTHTGTEEDGQDGTMSMDKGDSYVLKALKEAFDAVDSPLTHDKLSFTEAGNPVMALAAFLTRLVEPGMADASARSSLKSMSKRPSGSVLAARHCFLLEDPPDDKKDQTVSESVAGGNTNQSPQELKNEENKNDKLVNHNEANSTNQIVENSNLLLSGTLPVDDPIQKKGSTSGDDTKLPVGNQDVSDEKLKLLEKSDEEKSEVADMPGEQKSSGGKSLAAENLSETGVEQAGQKLSSDSRNSHLKNDQSPKEDGSVLKSNPPSAANESGNLNTAAEAVQSIEAPKEVGLESSSILSDVSKQQEKVLPELVEGASSQAGKNKMEVDKTGDPKVMEPTKAEDDPGITKVKRAAVATLSASAVKAKLLATHEEDEIRQLANLLIEKQLRKLELKLSYFSDMDNAIMRFREQLDRSKQKLYGERAQIIANRLGYSASSSRAFPMNRVHPGILNSIMRPSFNMAAQRPPMPRPVVNSAAPPTTNAATPNVVGGVPTQPNVSEKSSAVETN